MVCEIHNSVITSFALVDGFHISTGLDMEKYGVCIPVSTEIL